MSTHAIEIVEIGDIFPHPNPEVERLSITKIWGWQCCIGKNDFKSGDKAVYIPPDYTCPLNRPEFAFLRNKNNEGKTVERIKVRKFKGALSQGLIIPVPEQLKHLPIGTNVINELEIERYEPPIPKSTYGMFVSGPSDLYIPKFDVENYQRYRELFVEGEEVIATEKTHGCNSRFVFAKDKDGNWKQFVGSRTNWMAEDEKNIWWMAFRQCSAIGEWCKANPEKIIYGECYGQVQSLKYGAGNNDIFFAAFGILDKQTWLDYGECQELVKPFPNLKWVPLVYRGPFNEKLLLEEAEKDSLYPNACHMREGICVIPTKERVSEEIGRVILKMVSNRYLEKA